MVSPQMASLRAAVGSSVGISPTPMVTGSLAWSRTTTSVTDCPGVTAATRRWSSGTSWIFSPANSTTTSPARMPAASAGPPFMTSAISTPCRSRTPKLPASSPVTSWMTIPSQPRTTRPPEMS